MARGRKKDSINKHPKYIVDYLDTRDGERKMSEPFKTYDEIAEFLKQFHPTITRNIVVKHTQRRSAAKLHNYFVIHHYEEPIEEPNEEPIDPYADNIAGFPVNVMEYEY